MESLTKNETLYFCDISLKTGLIGLSDYSERLNALYYSDDDEKDILIELESYVGDLKDTIRELDAYLFDKIAHLDYQEIGRMILDEVKEQYNNNPNALEELTHVLYRIWTLLPREVSEEEPFVRFISIDDPWSWDGEEQVKESVDRLLDYYN